MKLETTNKQVSTMLVHIIKTDTKEKTKNKEKDDKYIKVFTVLNFRKKEN